MFEKDKFYCIIGVKKCGTTSLEKWMRQNKYTCKRKESFVNLGQIGSHGIDGYGPKWTGMTGAQYYKKHRKGWIPVMILRDPIKRIFSHYHYKQNHQRGDFYEIKDRNLKDALDNHPELVECSNYDKFLDEWSELSPIILYFEDVIKWDGFPHETHCECNIKMSAEDEKLIRSKITYKLHSNYI